MAKGILTMSSSFEDDDDEMERILGQMDGSQEFDAVDIGVLSDEEELLRIYASANEFGTRDGHIPERSFIRMGVDLNETAINQRSEVVWGQIVDGRIQLKNGLGQMGEFIQRIITRRIVDLKTPPNAPSTIAKKKSSNPLIDTGRMRQSIRWEMANSADGEAGI